MKQGVNDPEVMPHNSLLLGLEGIFLPLETAQEYISFCDYKYKKANFVHFNLFHYLSGHAGGWRYQN